MTQMMISWNSNGTAEERNKKMFKLFSRKKRPVADTLIDVRGHNGFKSHLILYGEYEQKAPTLCGVNLWLEREDPNEWAVNPQTRSITTEHYCSDCVSKLSALQSGKN